jgi:hypothetical protein
MSHKYHINKMYLKVIHYNNKLTELFNKPLKKYIRADILPSTVRWGTEGLLLTWAIFFLSLFFTIKFTSSYDRGVLMEWVFLGLGVIGLLAFVNLAFYFLTHQSKDPSMKQMNKMDKGIDDLQMDMGIIKANLNELPKITKLLEDIKEGLNNEHSKHE